VISTDKPIGIDLFAGAGGLSCGLLQAGFNIKLGVERDKYSAQTLSANHPEMNVVLSDIRLIDPDNALKQAQIRAKDVAIVAGGPPCQGFSQSNKRTRNMANPLNRLYLDFFRFVKAIKPPIFLFENVQGLRTLNNGEVLNDILKTAQDLGYFAQWQVINAECCGVPQKRRRIFIIGSKQKTVINFNCSIEKATTVRQSINDLPILENGNRSDCLKYSKNKALSEYQISMRKGTSSFFVKNNFVTRNSDLVIERYKKVPPGGCWKDIPKALMHNYRNVENCHRWIYHRLKWDDSAVSIGNFRKNMLIHPEQNRNLSVREAARLQSFRDSYVFFGTSEAQQQQVANAVPPLMAKEIGARLIEYLEYN
jgi:DNA (cytosine-5)-methyltransferase 1